MSPGGENIGGMNVSIDADYSPLAAAYSTAQSMSQTAGTDIANALGVVGPNAAMDEGQKICNLYALANSSTWRSESMFSLQHKSGSFSPVAERRAARWKMVSI